MKLKSEQNTTSTIHQILLLLKNSFEILKAPITDSQIESMGINIHEIMTARWRKYHVPQHLIEMCKGADPIEVLATLFHDIVYVQVDRRIHPKIAPILSEFIIDQKYQCTLPQYTNDPYHYIKYCYDFFHFTPGTTISTSNGLNEFLSAITAARTLGPFLNNWEIIQIIGAIEATIPFRLDHSNRDLSFQYFENKYSELNKTLKLSKSPSDIRIAIHRALNVSHKDVAGFSSTDTSEFLGQTWNLLLESNPIFKNPLFTVRQYRIGLLKMEEFFNQLKIEAIFCRYKDYPTDSQYNQMCKNAELNLKRSVEYLKSKITMLSILEAIALQTGGDCPFVMLVGISSENDRDSTHKLIKFLDQTIPVVSEDEIDQEVLKLLAIGRKDTQAFDVKQSPITAYLYCRINRATREKLFEDSIKFFKGEIEPLKFLQLIPRQIIESIILGCIELATTRKQLLEGLYKSIKQSQKTVSFLNH